MPRVIVPPQPLESLEMQPRGVGHAILVDFIQVKYTVHPNAFATRTMKINLSGNLIDTNQDSYYTSFPTTPRLRFRSSSLRPGEYAPSSDPDLESLVYLRRLSDHGNQTLDYMGHIEYVLCMASVPAQPGEGHRLL